MNHVRKKSLTVTVFCLLLSTVAACTTTETAAPESSKPAEGTKTGNQKAPVKIVSISGYSQYVKNNETEKHVHDIIQEKTGVDVQRVFSTLEGRAAYNQKVNLMLSSGEQLDIVPFSTIDDAVQWYKNGAIIPINDLLDQYGPNLKKNISPQAWAEVTVGGKIIGIPSPYQNSAPYITQIRTDWLKNVNLPMPATLEDFEKVMDAFLNNDPDRNGKKDTYPLNAGSGATPLKELELGFAPYFLPQAMEWWQDDQGKLLPPEMHPGYKAMLAKLVEWNKKGYIWPEMLLSTNSKRLEAIAQNKIGTVSGWWTSPVYGGTELLVKTIPDANYEPFLLQGGPGVNKLQTVPGAQQVTVITKQSKNPEAAMKFLDFHATREGYDMTYYGLEGESYKKMPDGTLEFIGGDKYDQGKANYYVLYWMFYMDWKDGGFSPWATSSWLNVAFNSLLKKVNNLPRFDYTDKGVIYQKAEWKSFAKLNDLETYLNEQKTKVFAGETPLSDWDAIMQKWREIGGSQMIEDKNAQFKAAKK